jgi:hypothetical protein
MNIIATLRQEETRLKQQRSAVRTFAGLMPQSPAKFLRVYRALE